MNWTYSAQARLLPYIEGGNIHAQIDFKQNLFSGHGDHNHLNPLYVDLIKSTISVLRCPSDGGLYDFMTHSHHGAAGDEVTGGNYMVCTGSGRDTQYDVRFQTDGVFNCFRWVGLAGMSDGTSNTMVLSETLVGASGGELDGNRDAVLTGKMYQRYLGELDDDGPTDSDTTPGFAAIPPNSDMNALSSTPEEWFGRRANCWMVGTAVDTSYNAYQTPNARYPDVHAGGLGIFTARSNHPGDANVTFGDGSVHFISDSVSRDLWQALATRSGGEAVSIP